MGRKFFGFLPVFWRKKPKRGGQRGEKAQEWARLPIEAASHKAPFCGGQGMRSKNVHSLYRI
jgi:hypothetical protein